MVNLLFGGRWWGFLRGFGVFVAIFSVLVFVSSVVVPH